MPRASTQHLADLSKAARKRRGPPAAPLPPALLRRLRRVVRALESEPCLCPLEAEPDANARTWESLCFQVERGPVETAERRRARREAEDAGEHVPPHKSHVSQEFKLLAILKGTRACFCATCHDHPVPLDTWLWLMEQDRPEEMAGPPAPPPAGARAEAKESRLALYESRAEAGLALFHPRDGEGEA